MINKKLIVFPIHEKVVLNLVFQLRRIYRQGGFAYLWVQPEARQWLDCQDSACQSRRSPPHTNFPQTVSWSIFWAHFPTCHTHKDLSQLMFNKFPGQVCSHFVQWHQTIFLALSNSDCPRYPVLRCWLAFTSQKSSPVYIYCVFCICICICCQC